MMFNVIIENSVNRDQAGAELQREEHWGGFEIR